MRHEPSINIGPPDAEWASGPSPQPEQQLEQLYERAAELEDANSRLEETLRRNSRIFEDLLSNGEVGITLTAPDRRIVKVVKGVTGFDPASLVGCDVESLVVPEDRAIIRDAYRRLLGGSCQKVRILVRIPHADGTVVLHTATLTDMLANPDIQGIVCNYSACPLLDEYAPALTSADTNRPPESSPPAAE